MSIGNEEKTVIPTWYLHALEGRLQICQFCKNYEPYEGKCELYNMKPPEDFRRKDKACDKWEGLPF